MNPNWKDFLTSNNAAFSDSQLNFPNTDNTARQLFALVQFGILKVSGQDAKQLLQGQLTCNLNDITQEKASLAAFCNAKGRAIATLLLVPSKDSYLVIVPKQLQDKVAKKLRMYILRSDVQLEDASDKLCLIGLNFTDKIDDLKLPERLFEASQNDEIFIKLPGDSERYLFIADLDKAKERCSHWLGELAFNFNSSYIWDYLDIISGLPWLTTETSEEYVPQMINLDKLDAISFNKGCYTGQEIIARTHYLGKNKRSLFLGTSRISEPPVANTEVLDNSNGQNVGKILCAQFFAEQCKMLVVLKETEIQSQDLVLNNPSQDKITLTKL